MKTMVWSRGGAIASPIPHLATALEYASAMPARSPRAERVWEITQA